MLPWQPILGPSWGNWLTTLLFGTLTFLNRLEDHNADVRRLNSDVLPTFCRNLVIFSQAISEIFTLEYVIFAKFVLFSKNWHI